MQCGFGGDGEMRCRIEHQSASEFAREAVTGPASLLGLCDILERPRI